MNAMEQLKAALGIKNIRIFKGGYKLNTNSLSTKQIRALAGLSLKHNVEVKRSGPGLVVVVNNEPVSI